MPQYILVVATMLVGSPGELVIPPVPFHNYEDCQRATQLALSLMPGPMKAFCFDMLTGEKIAEVEK